MAESSSMARLGLRRCLAQGREWWLRLQRADLPGVTHHLQRGYRSCSPWKPPWGLMIYGWYEGILIGNLHNWSEIEELCGLWILQPWLMTRGPRRNHEVIFHVVNHVFPPKVGGSIHVYPRVGPLTAHRPPAIKCGSAMWGLWRVGEKLPLGILIIPRLSPHQKKTKKIDDLCSGCSLLKSKCTSRARSIYSEYFWIIITGWWFVFFIFYFSIYWE